MRILVLDDDEIVRKSLVYYFEDTEWLPVEAESGEEALEVIRNNQLDGAIVDQRLPGMDGDTFVRHALAITGDMAFVICSGSIEYELPPDLKTSPCVSDRVFVKPVADMEPMETEISRILNQLRGDSEPTEN